MKKQEEEVMYLLEGWEHWTAGVWKGGGEKEKIKYKLKEIEKAKW